MGPVSAARAKWARLRTTNAWRKAFAPAVYATSRAAGLVNAVRLELLAGLAILTGSAWIFGWMVEDLAEGDTKVDHRFANWLHEHATPRLTTFFENVTRLGNVSTLVVVVLVGVVVLWRKRLFRDLVLLLLAAVGAEMITVGLKLGFERERPFFSDPLAHESSYSFPSGHASVSLAVYGTIGFIAARHLAGRKAQVAALAAAAVLIVFIGFSRLYLGVHFLSDVVAGFSLGLAWVTLCAVLLHLRLRFKERGQIPRYPEPMKQ
jgi:membrane-associated phospholipid phosphatase